MSENKAAAEWVDLKEIRPWARNPRKFDHKIPEAITSLRRFGFCAPIVVWERVGMLVAGHCRIKAMRTILKEDPRLDGLGGSDPELAEANAKLRESLTGPTFNHLPVRFREFENEAEAEAYGLRDNNALGDWDNEPLDEILRTLNESGVELEGLGFDETILQRALGEDADDLMDPGEGGDAASKPPAIAFGRYRFLLSPADNERMTARLDRWIEEKGSEAGFGKWIVDHV